MDPARDAVAEGQATAVMMDYILKGPPGKSLIEETEVLDVVRSRMTSTEDTPVMARAPLLLLGVDAVSLARRPELRARSMSIDQGQAAAFAGTLDRHTTYNSEIIDPRMYKQKHIHPMPLLPNIHPLVDPLYEAYDIGNIGKLDMRIVTQL